MERFITRRALATNLLASFPLLPGGRARAEIACRPYSPLMELCTVGVRIGPVPTARQACQNWCWAACVEAIFSLHGFPVYQEEIVQTLYGQLVCRTATGPNIVNTINSRPWVSRRGDRFRARARPLVDLSFGVQNPRAAAQASQQLAAGKPLINGATGHATVLTAMTYLRDQFGNGQPVELVVRDPWPFAPNRRVLTPSEVHGTFFLASVDVFPF